MRSMAIPFICVILVFSLWFFSIDYTSDTKKNLIPALSEAVQFAEDEDWENTEESYKNFIAMWQKYSNIYAYYMNSAEVDEIELALKRCAAYIEAENKGLVCGEIADIIARLEQIYEGSLFSAENIL